MKISLSVRLYIAAIIAVGSIVIIAAIFSFYKANDVQLIWLDFNQSRSEKNRVLSALREQIGFGGMIHNYKNYILRKKIKDKETVLISIGGAKATLSRYKKLPLNDYELIAINHIENALLSYEAAVDTVQLKIQQGLSAKKIDKIVKIDDAFALAGLNELEKNIHLNIKNKSQILSSKYHLISRIRKELGYGGMIHFYKNYILRNNSTLKLNAEKSLNLLLGYVKQYSEFQLNKKENDALNVFSQYLNLYKGRLTRLDKLIAKGLSPRDIDKRVKVNDIPILDSLVVLEQQTALYAEVRAESLNNSIDHIVSSAKFIGFVTFIIFLFITAGSYWFVRLQIVKPIVSLIGVMRKLSKNNFDVEIHGAETNNEIGDMAKSVEDFRNTAKARLEIDKELTQMNAELELRVEERTRKLEYNQSLLQAIVETAVDAIIVFDDKGIVKSFNAAAEIMFGYDKNIAIGKSINTLISKSKKSQQNVFPDDYSGDTADVLQTGKDSDLTAIRNNEEKFPVEIAIAELVLDKKKMFTVIIRDVSQRHFHEAQIRRTQKMDALGKLTGGIAHDYNNMLGIVIGYAGLLTDTLPNDSKLSGYANEIYKAGERGAKLTNKLLEFSRHKTSKEKEVVNINMLLGEMNNMLKKTLTARIELDCHFQDKLWDVNIDVSDFENALLNLSINAMHAMDESGKLTIRTENISMDHYLSNILDLAPGDYVKLSIIDTGCGIEDDIRNSIFDPFFSTKAEKGTGLGLSQVYGFVQRSDGAIKVYSELGEGTSFTLYLPRISQGIIDKDNASLANINFDELNGTESILVVDDEPALAILAQEILISFGYKIYTAANGIEAMESLKKHTIDLILTDIVMPEMDGITLAKEVKYKYPNIPVQFASGYNAVSPKARKDLDDEDIITKPYSSVVLVTKIRQVLDSKSNI